MPAIDLTSDTLAIQALVGDARSLEITATDENDAAISWSGVTFAAPILDRSNVEVGTWTMVPGAAGALTMELSSATTTSIGEGVFSWYLRVTRAGKPVTWIRGVLALAEPGKVS